MSSDADQKRDIEAAFQQADSARYAALGATAEARDMAARAAAARDSAGSGNLDEASNEALDAALATDRAARACAHAVNEAIAAYNVVTVPALAAIVAEVGRLLAESFEAARVATQAYRDIAGAAPTDET